MRTVCYLAHCLLNANAKVDGGARCEGVSSPVVSLLREHGCAIRQMPCPELAFGGTRRFWAVREQLDTPVFRAHCRRLATPVAAQIQADLAHGARVLVLGIDGSPSMGVELTAASEEWGGRPDKPRDEDYPVTPGPRAVHGDAARASRRAASSGAHRRHRPGSLRLRRGARGGEGRPRARRRGRRPVTVAGASECGAWNRRHRRVVSWRRSRRQATRPEPPSWSRSTSRTSSPGSAISTSSRGRMSSSSSTPCSSRRSRVRG